jgi:hypothetical protein
MGCGAVWMFRRNIIPSSLILFTLMLDAIRSSVTSGLTRATRRRISEHGILHSHRRENLRSYACSSYLTKYAMWPVSIHS